MNIESMVGEFLSSSAGNDAKNALLQKGIGADQAQAMLQHAATAAGDHMEHQHGVLGANPGKSFFAAFAAGIVRGDGLMGALGDGMEGVIVARVTQAITEHMGIDSAVAQTAAAAATPYIVGFLKKKLAG